jgi:hypothetical protein
MNSTILPMSRSLYRYLDDIGRGNYGAEVINIILTGFIQMMLVRNFDLERHLHDIDEIDGLFGCESRDMKLDLSLGITRMIIAYRNYFPSRKHRAISIRRCTFNKSALRFTFEVKDERS